MLTRRWWCVNDVPLEVLSCAPQESRLSHDLLRVSEACDEMLMALHPEDLRYWGGWLVWSILAVLAARLFLVNPILRALERLR